MMLANCFVSLSAEKEPGVAQAVPGDHSVFSAQEVVPVSTVEGYAGRLVEDLSITQDGSIITLNWSEVPEAVSYKVYSSDSPDHGFTEDSSGSFNGTNWTTTITAARRFYYVTSVSSDVPAGFVFVPGGTFWMGDTRGGGFPVELPVHSVTLSPFFIGEHEVTQAEYTAIMGGNPCSGFGVGDNYPVYFVSWYSILVYCNLRSMVEGLTPVYSISGSTDPSIANWGYVPISNDATWDAVICDWSADGYRLPTEAEWEYAARGAANYPDYLYAGSDDIDAVAWYSGNNSPSGTKPVGTKAPNGIGTFDMSGNVWEWCWDWYSSTYYSNSPGNNPTGPTSGSSRLLRGGYWSVNANYCRVSFRNNHAPYYRNDFSGFRLCRSMN